MRIVHYAREVHFHGGIENVVAHLNREFRAAGHESACRTTRWGRWLQRSRPRSRLLRKLWLAAEMILYGLESLRFRDPPDTIRISYSDALRCDVLVFQSCHKALVRERIRQGKMGPALDPVTWVGLLRDEIPARWMKPRYVVAVSPETLEEVRREYPGLRGVPARVILNGVDTRRFSAPESAAARREVRDALGIADDDFVLVLVASRFPIKGVDTAIRALPLSPAAVRLVVVGGDDAAPYRRLAAELNVAGRVRFVGHAARPDPFYHAADAFVLPTRYEPFGIVGIEALAAGLPILMTPTGGIVTYLEPGVNGFFVQDEHDVARHAAALRADPALHERLRGNARASAARHAWPLRAREYLEVAGEVARMKGAGSAVPAGAPRAAPAAPMPAGNVPAPASPIDARD